MDYLMKLSIDYANRHYDGHLTIMKFTTNWKVTFGTPNSRGEIDRMATGKTIEEALFNAMITDQEDELHV